MLEQRLTFVEGTLQHSVEKHGHADAIHAKLTRGLGALQVQSASEPSLRGAHPDTVLQRLDALEDKLSDELRTEANLDDGLTQGACARDTVQRRLDALEAKLDDSLMKAASIRDNAVYDLQMRYNELVTKLDGPVRDSVSALYAALAAEVACAPAALVASQNQSSSESSLRDMHPDTLQQRLDAPEKKLSDELTLEDQSATEPSLRGTHPDTVQQRLDALRQRPRPLTEEESSEELALTASPAADVHCPLGWQHEAWMLRSGRWTRHASGRLVPR